MNKFFIIFKNKYYIWFEKLNILIFNINVKILESNTRILEPGKWDKAFEVGIRSNYNISDSITFSITHLQFHFVTSAIFVNDH